MTNKIGVFQRAQAERFPMNFRSFDHWCLARLEIAKHKRILCLGRVSKMIWVQKNLHFFDNNKNLDWKMEIIGSTLRIKHLRALNFLWIKSLTSQNSVALLDSTQLPSISTTKVKASDDAPFD